MSQTVSASRLRSSGRGFFVGISSSFDIWDVALMGSVGCAAGWQVVAAADGGDPVPSLQLLGLVAATYLVARFVSLVAPGWVVPALVVISVGALVVGSGDGFTAHPLSGPFGYSNATAALLVEGACAIGTLFAPGGARSRIVAVVVIAATTVGIFAIDAIAGAALAGFVLVVALVPLPLFRKAALALLAAIAVITLVGTVASAALPPGDPMREAVAARLSDRRLALWGDALQITLQNPSTGVGPRRFVVASPVAAGDADTRHTHNELLQQTSETGIIGGLILVAIFVCAVARAWRSQQISAPFVGLAVVSLAIYASIDYVLHFPAIAASTATLAGTVLPMQRKRVP